MSKPLRKVSLKKKQEIPSPFVLVVSYPKESKVILEAFKGNNTIYQVIQTCINKFGLKFDENNQFILRYAHQVLDPMVSLSESRIPKSSELILENVAHISTNPIVDVTLRDIEEGIVQAGKFDENENLWNVAEKLIPNGKYIRPDKVKICSSEISFIGKKQLEATKLNSAFRGSHVDLRLCPTYSDIDNQEAEYEKKKKLRRQRTSKKAAMTDGNYNLLNIRTKMTTINKSTKVSTLKQLSGVYYIGSRHGIAYLRDEHDENISLMSVHSSAKNYVTQETHLYNPPELTNKENMELTLNFPNGVSFKAIFRKDEQIKDVVKFVKPYLTEKMQPFYFYTLYPRLIMPYNKVLKDISFMPPYNQLQVSFGREYNPKVNYLKKEIIRSLKKNPFTSMLSQMFSKE